MLWPQIWFNQGGFVPQMPQKKVASKNWQMMTEVPSVSSSNTANMTPMSQSDMRLASINDRMMTSVPLNTPWATEDAFPIDKIMSWFWPKPMWIPSQEEVVSWLQWWFETKKALPVALPKMSLQQFWDTIKEKYPEYADKDSIELWQKMLEKYPEYSDRVDTVANPMQEWKTPEISMPTQPIWEAIGQDLTLWWWLLTLWISKLLKTPEQFSKFVQDNAEKLKSRLVWWVKEADRQLINQAADIVANYVDDNVKTFGDLVNNFDAIKSKYYTDSWLKKIFDDIKVGKNDPIVKRIWDVTKSMIDTLKTKWKVKLWLEPLYNEILWIRDKLYKWELTWTDANNVKKKIDKFFSVFWKDWDVKWWLTKEWAANIYKEIKWYLEDKAMSMWKEWVQEINKWYQWLLKMEDYIKRIADQASRASAKSKDVSFTQRFVQKVMDMADVIPWVSSAKWAVQWALRSFWVWGSQTMTAAEIEQQLPEILKKIKQATKDDSVVRYVEKAISEWAKEWIPKVVKWWKGMVSKLKWWLFGTLAWVLFDNYNPWMNAVFTNLDYIDNPENYYQWEWVFRWYILPKDVVDESIDDNWIFEIDDRSYKLKDNTFIPVVKA